MIVPTWRIVALSAVILLIPAGIVLAQDPNAPANTAPQGQTAKRAIKSPDDLKDWQSLAGGTISSDGRWVAYGIGHYEGDPKGIIRSSDGPEKWEIPYTTRIVFSDDSKWAAYSIGVSKADSEKMAAQKQPVRMKLGLRSLPEGKEQTVENVRSFQFLKGSKFLLISRYPGQGKNPPSADLQVMNLANGTTLTIGNVMGFRLNKEETLIALNIESDSGEHGMQLFNPASGTLQTLQWGKDDVGPAIWARKADTLGFLVGTPNPKKEGAANRVVVYSGVGSDPKKTEYDPAKDDKFPKEMRIAESGGLRISEDGTKFWFGIKDWPDKKTPDGKKPEDKPGVDIWHYKDVDVQPLQQSLAGQAQSKTLRSTWNVSNGEFKQLETDELISVNPIGDGRFAIITDPKPYRSAVKPGGLTYADYYVWDLQDGTKTKIVEKRQFGVSPSRKGNYVMYYQQKNWWLYDCAAKKSTNVTRNIKTRWDDVDYDGPQQETPAAAGVMWMEGEAAFIFDKFDTYLVEPTMAEARRITEGAAENLTLRPTDVGWHEDGIRLADPIYFRVFDNNTMKAGLYRRETDGTGKMLTYDGVQYGLIQKSKDTDRIIFSMESDQKTADLYLTNATFDAAKPMSRLNPQQSQFFWPKQELISFTTKSGWKLHGILTYPADYDPKRQYPMITYIYEKLSDGMYNYESPSDTNPYSAQMFAQKGYFVLRPDITYRTNDPGLSALECIETAVQTVLKKNVGVDPRNLGLTGHSWGGYQTTFVHTKSKLFKAAAAGAPLTELVSMSNSFYWNWGETNQVIFESSQGRFNKPWYDIPDAYTRNSAMWNAKTINGPFMMLFGTSDGAVDWHQGQYYYNTLRRMGKEVIMVVYEGENHFPAKKANVLDFTYRVRHFFDVNLQGAKADPWVTEGVPFIKKP
ncbi:MAG: prolyl oligopeptidase family serine peptidase [Fimbriimonadaceae bacterium]|nr:prolyl oligopeptidase family serine peptidase [Fimbriimonadaceae bacterium]